MGILILGLLLFLAIHSVAIVNPSWRDRMAAKTGELVWKGLYSLIAIAGLVLIVQGYGLARLDPTILYTPPLWLHDTAILLLAPVFPLLLAAYIPGRIQTVTKHPMLVAVKLWAAAHLLANGAVADLVLFGALLAWAVVDRLSLRRRSAAGAPHLPRSRINDAIVVVAGLALYGAFILWLHAWLIGVPVMSR